MRISIALLFITITIQFGFCANQNGSQQEFSPRQEIQRLELSIWENGIITEGSEVWFSLIVADFSEYAISIVNPTKKRIRIRIHDTDPGFNPRIQAKLCLARLKPAIFYDMCLGAQKSRSCHGFSYSAFAHRDLLSYSGL